MSNGRRVQLTSPTAAVIQRGWRTRLPVWALLIAVCGGGSVYAWHEMFTGVRFYDDEGLVLQALQRHARGDVLYEELATQYGPAYFLFNQAVFRASGLSIRHEVLREQTAVLWLFGAAVYGLSVFRLTQQLIPTLLAALLTLLAASGLSSEPGHPQAFLFAATGLLMLLITGFPHRAAILTGGALTGFICTTKINIGVLVALACLLGLLLPRGERSTAGTAIARAREEHWKRMARIACTGSAIAIPVLLVRHSLDVPQIRVFLLITIIGLTNVFILSSSIRQKNASIWSLSSAIGFAGSGAAAGTAVLATAVWSGTTLGGLYDGLIGQHIQFADRVFLPPPWPGPFLVLTAVFSLGVSLWWRHRERSRTGRAEPDWHPHPVLTGLKLLLTGAITIGVFVDWRLTPYLLPWSCLILCDVPPTFLGRDSRPARQGLLALATLLFLQAYPVAGTQWKLAGLNLIPLAGVALADAQAALGQLWRSQSSRTQAEASRGARVGVRGMLSPPVVPGVILMAAAVAVLGDKTTDSCTRHAQAAAPVTLAGMDGVRIPEQELIVLEGVTWNLRENAEAVFCLPGMYSFCSWSDRDSVTGQNQTNWPLAFGARRQQRIVEDLRGHSEVVLLQSQFHLDFWNRDRRRVDGPAVRAAREQFIERLRIGDYVLATLPGTEFVWIGAAWTPATDRSGLQEAAELLVHCPPLARRATTFELVNLQTGDSLKRKLTGDSRAQQSAVRCLRVSLPNRWRQMSAETLVVRLRDPAGALVARLPLVQPL